MYGISGLFSFGQEVRHRQINKYTTQNTNPLPMRASRGFENLIKKTTVQSIRYKELPVTTQFFKPAALRVNFLEKAKNCL